MSGFLIGKAGEAPQFVGDAAKYVVDGWEVLGEGDAFRPREGCDWIDGKWTPNPAKIAARVSQAARNMLLTDPASMLAKIEALEARLALLERRP